MWQPNKKDVSPLYQQIINHLIQVIQKGDLMPGDHLLSERKLAEAYQVNRSTVVRALDELESYGWIERIRGSGTRVLESSIHNRQIPTPFIRLLGRSNSKEDPYTIALKRKIKEPTTLDLYTGDLPIDLIPNFQFPQLSWEELIDAEQQLTTTGYLPLKAQIKKKLARHIQHHSSNQKILITSGSTQGIILLLQTLLQHGDCIGTEATSFLYSLPIFSPLGIELQGIKQDNEGIDCNDLEAKLQKGKIKLLYLNPNFQNPTSTTMSLARRQTILELCKKYQIPIIEDDVFGDLTLQTPLPTLKELAPEQVIYLGSFSKLFSSRIKIGWIYANAPLITRLAQVKNQTEQETDLLPQLLLTAALTDSAYEPKHQALLSEMRRRSESFTTKMTALADYWDFSPIEGGLYYWLTWKHERLSRKDWQLFLDYHLALAPAFLFGDSTNQCRVNYTRLSIEQQVIFFDKLQQISQQIKSDSRHPLR